MADLWSAIAWRIFSVLVFLVVCYQLSMTLSKRTVFHQVPAKQALQSTIDLDFCYLVNIKNDNLSLDHLEDERQPSRGSSKQKRPTNLCDLSKPISVNGKRLQNTTVKQIIEEFKKCKLENLIKLQNRTTIKRMQPNVSYELYCDHICVRHRFEIETSVEWTDMEITPLANNQTFQILVSFSRLFREDGEYRSIRKPIYKRTCRPTEKERYLCTETNKKFYLELFYSTIESLKSPFATDCVERGSKTQNDCYEDCIKRKKKHVSLSYTERDEFGLDFKLNFDRLAVMRPLIKSCTAHCRQPDCRSGSITFKEITEKTHPNSFINLRISEDEQMFKASPYYSKLKISWLLIAFFCLIFKINLYGQLCRFKGIYDYVDSKNQRIKSEKKLCLILVISIIGFALAVVFEKLAFDLGRNTGFVTYKLESVRERSLSVSICFNPCDIVKDSIDSSMANCSDALSLEEFEQITWTETDFKRFVTLRNSVRIVYLREMKVHVFYRDLLKCFLVYYRAPNHYTQIALQRKSEIHFNVSRANNFSFYLEDAFSYPKIDSTRIRFSFLHYAYIKDLHGMNCNDYSKKPDSCLSQDDCQQQCILQRYAKRRRTLPAFVNLKIDHLSNYSTLRIDKDEPLYAEVKSECRLAIAEPDCDYVKTRFRSKYNQPIRHNLSINLTPVKFLQTPLRDEHELIVLNRMISLMLILTGFSTAALFKRLLVVFFSMRLSFIGYQYLRRLCNLAVFLAFLLHFRFLVDCVMFHEMEKFTFRFYSRFIKVPVLRLCYELDLDMDTNNYTVSLLNNLTLKNDELFEKVLILDTVYRFNKTEKNAPVAIQPFYLDTTLGATKCFNLLVDERIGLSNKNFFGLDESIKIFVNLNNLPRKRFLLFINDVGVWDLDWYKFWFPNRYYLFYYTDQQFTYQDEFWFVKNFVTLVRYWFGIETPRNTQKSYSNHLKRVFNRQQSATTTSVPLYPDDEDLPIKNQRFQNFMHFRSLEGDKNEFDFTINSQRYNFLSDYYHDQSYDLGNRTVLSFVSSTIYSASLTTNRYHLVELFLHLSVLFAFWFKTSLAYLPKSIKRALPFIKFFAVCILYLIVVILILLFKVIFSIIKFLNFRQV